MFNDLDTSVKNLVMEVVQLAYYMRGAITYDDLMWRTPFERQIIDEFIEGRLKSEAKKHFPVY